MDTKVVTASALEEVSRIVENGIAALPKTAVPKVKIKEGKGDEEEVCLLLSDLQIGHKTPTTCAKIIGERLDRLSVNLLKIVTLHRHAYPIRKLNIFLMGDIIHGEEVGRRVSLDELELVLFDQVFQVAVPCLEKFILALVPYFPEIHLWCVPGNHGGIDKFHAETTNFDTIIYKVLEGRLSGYETVKWHVEACKFYQKVKIFKWTFLEVHGDQINMWMNIPWYGITQKAMRWKGALPGGDYQYLVVGHFHVPSWFTWNDLEVFCNGCFVSDDQWVLKKIGTATKPTQVMFGVHPKKGVTFRYQIHLD